MIKLIKGYKGLDKTPCEILVYNDWYCYKGSNIIHRTCTTESLRNGVWINEIEDKDVFNSNKNIDTFNKLKKTVSNYQLYKRKRILERKEKYEN